MVDPLWQRVGSEGFSAPERRLEALGAKLRELSATVDRLDARADEREREAVDRAGAKLHEHEARQDREAEVAATARLLAIVDVMIATSPPTDGIRRFLVEPALMQELIDARSAL